MNKIITLKEIVEFLEDNIIEIKGKIEDLTISNIKATGEVDKDSLDWINPTKLNKQEIAEKSKAKVILCDSSIQVSKNIALQEKVLIYVKNPKMMLAIIADYFFIDKPLPGIHITASINPESVISESVYIGSNCSIGKCIIGEGTRIYPNVTIYDGTCIGNSVIIQAGAVIGTDGLGCERQEDGTLVKFSHLGGIVIGNNVEIGANCQIARGALSDTIIGDGSKINGLCFIAHNCIIKKNVLITGNTMLAGSVTVEDNVTIYSNVIIREQRTIGSGSTIGMGSVVTKDVPAHETWLGNPAKKFEKKVN
jgi:UDP-3-O-[3-hydroxymyristoyl] glucosamine N-acyltransferase